MAKKEYPYQNRSLKDMKGEEWKDIPDFIDHYQISNYGRFKSLERWMERPPKGDMLLKEKILKQSVSKHFNPYTKKYYTYLSNVGLLKNGIRNSIKTGRLVYYHFVKKFDLKDPTLVVVPKNGDNLDLRYTNLILIKKGEVQVKTYQEKRKKKPFKSVSQYDINGHLIKTYPSIIEAAAETGYRPGSISQAIHGHDSHCGGWLWKFGIRKKIRAVKFPYRHVKRIAQYTLHGKLVSTFFSITEAEKITGFDDMGMRDAAKKRRASYKGFVWKYVD